MSGCTMLIVPSSARIAPLLECVAGMCQVHCRRSHRHRRTNEPMPVRMGPERCKFRSTVRRRQDCRRGSQQLHAPLRAGLASACAKSESSCHGVGGRPSARDRCRVVPGGRPGAHSSAQASACTAGACRRPATIEASTAGERNRRAVPAPKPSAGGLAGNGRCRDCECGASR